MRPLNRWCPALKEKVTPAHRTYKVKLTLVSNLVNRS